MTNVTFLLAVCAIFVVNNQAQAQSSADPSAVDILYNQDKCAPVLRVPMYTEITKANIQSYKDFIKYDWCKVQFHNETEARDHGFNMNAVYDALNISATDTDKFSKAAQWKTANCGSVLSTSDHSIVDAEYKKLLSVPVALAAISAWKACITAPPSGLACSTISNNPSSVTFYARYIPNIAGVVPKVTSSSASNVKPAGGQPPHTQPIAIFKAGKVITPQGIYANFDILEPSEDVQFQLSADATIGDCTASVSAQAVYQINADITLYGDIQTEKDFNFTDRVIHNQCADYLIRFPSNNHVIDNGYSVVPGSLGVSQSGNQKNPFVPAGSNCFSVVDNKITRIQGNIFDAEVDVQECSMPVSEDHHLDPSTCHGHSCLSQELNTEQLERLRYLFGKPEFYSAPVEACNWARQNGTNFSLTVKGTRSERVKVSETKPSISAAGSGAHVFTYPNVPSTIRNPQVRYDVWITRVVPAPENIHLTNDPSAPQTDHSGYHAVFEMSPNNNRLVVTVP